ncbi:MAG: protein kinase [Bacteroidales bacterium]|jgi:serine/threonine protein kinase|nr:protein kinase [Bacteroidales bacterium]
MNEIAERCEFDIGDRITENYSIEKKLGAGTFGIVFKVKDKRNNNIRALKLFKFWELSATERSSMIPRFQIEYETGLIKSNYLVHSFESGFIKGNPYIVMEYCPHGDLSQFVGMPKSVDLVKIGKEVLYGLKDLHSCGKVHRDLKPENVLINSNGAAVLTDFGISGDRSKRNTVTDFLGRPTEISGTPIYMAPEQARPKNKEVTVLPTMDIFAFGVMMYVIITNKNPFGELENENDLVLYFKNAREGNWDKKNLLKYPEGKNFDKVVSGCLIPDYKQRLQNADAVLDLLPHCNNISYNNSNNDFQRNAVHGILLRVMQGEEYGMVYKLSDFLTEKCKIITMGCNDKSVFNTLTITENLSRYISRKHCTLENNTMNQWYLRDGQWDRTMPTGWKRSLNGTFVNSSEVSNNGMPIYPGDIITIGDVKLRVEGY